VSANDLKSELQDLHISAAREVELGGNRRAVIIFVPFKLLKEFHKIHIRLIRELEKKFRCALLLDAHLCVALIRRFGTAAAML
jgi:hypothetical protein